MKGGNNGPQK